MADKKFKGAPFGTQTARFDVTGVHPKTKVPGSFTQIPYDKYSMVDLQPRLVNQAVPLRQNLSISDQLRLRKIDNHLKNTRQSLAMARKSMSEILSMKEIGEFPHILQPEEKCNNRANLPKKKSFSKNCDSAFWRQTIGHDAKKCVRLSGPASQNLQENLYQLNQRHVLNINSSFSFINRTFDTDGDRNLNHPNDSDQEMNVANGPPDVQASTDTENGNRNPENAENGIPGGNITLSDPHAEKTSSNMENQAANYDPRDTELERQRPDTLVRDTELEKQASDIKTRDTELERQTSMKGILYSKNKPSDENLDNLTKKVSFEAASLHSSQEDVHEQEYISTLDSTKKSKAPDRKPPSSDAVLESTELVTEPAPLPPASSGSKLDTVPLVEQSSQHIWRSSFRTKSTEIFRRDSRKSFMKKKSSQQVQRKSSIPSGRVSFTPSGKVSRTPSGRISHTPSGTVSGTASGRASHVLSGSSMSMLDKIPISDNLEYELAPVVETKSMGTVTSDIYLGPSNVDEENIMIEAEAQEKNVYDVLKSVKRLVYNKKGEPMMLKKLWYSDVNMMVPVPPNSVIDDLDSIVQQMKRKRIRPKPETKDLEPCHALLKRKLGPGAYNVMRGGFSQKEVEQKATGPGWARQLEVERLAALPHLLYKEQWEENKLLKRKLGPGSYEIKDFIEMGNEKPRSERGICDNLAPRFEKSVLSSTPGPGTYGVSGVPQKALEEKDNKSTSTKGMLDAGDRKRNLPSVGSHLGPGTYNHKSCTDVLINKVTSLKGPYKLFSGDRNQPISEGYFAAPRHADLGPGQYDIGSFVDELQKPHKNAAGRFGKRAQYPEVPTERVFIFSKTHHPKMKDAPGPGSHSPGELSKPQAVHSPGFLSSAKRDDKMSQKFFTRNFNPVGAGRYDIQKYEEAQDVNGHTSVFRSKTGKPNLQMSKFLQERIRGKDVKVEDRVFLCQPQRMTRSITVM